MTAPGYRLAKCRCSHTKDRHEVPGFDGECTADGCKCLSYRPSVAEAPARTTPPGLAHTPPAARPPLASVPPTTPAAPAPPVNPTPAAVGPSIEQLVAAGKRSDVKRTVVVAGRVEELLTELRARLVAERASVEAKRQREAEKQAARAEIAALEKELADAKAKLRGTTTPPAAKPKPATVGGTHPCPVAGCDRTFDSPYGAVLHRRRAHEGFNPRSTKAAG
jgi:pyruvate/2-oxoglutarate dehydrogenase complex dihydrolipoamide acyltransferase (E2) component